MIPNIIDSLNYLKKKDDGLSPLISNLKSEWSDLVLKSNSVTTHCVAFLTQSITKGATEAEKAPYIAEMQDIMAEINTFGEKLKYIQDHPDEF